MDEMTLQEQQGVVATLLDGTLYSAVTLLGLEADEEVTDEKDARQKKLVISLFVKYICTLAAAYGGQSERYPSAKVDEVTEHICKELLIEFGDPENKEN